MFTFKRKSNIQQSTQEVPTMSTITTTVIPEPVTVDSLPDPSVLDTPRSAWDLPIDTTADAVVEWAECEFLAGAKLATADIRAKLGQPTTAVVDLSAPAQRGYCSVVRAAIENNTRPKRVRQITEAYTESGARRWNATEISKSEEMELDLAAAKRANRQEANALIEQSAAASMKPVGMSAYGSAELNEAMAVLERFGRFSEEGGYHPATVITLDSLATEFRASSDRNKLVQQEKAYDVVKKRIFQYCADPALRIRHKLSLYFDRTLGRGEWAPAGTPEFILVSLPTNTRAYRERGECAWLINYLPVTFVGRDGQVRGAFQPGEKRPGFEDGVLGVVAVFKSLHEATQAHMDISRAINTIARERTAADQYHTEFMDAPDHVAPEIEADSVV